MQLRRSDIKISVRDLVEFILRSGDIDNRRLSATDRDAMQAGSRLHRKIQNGMKSGYHAEVLLKIQVEQPDFTITIEGRADGILEEESAVTIDEIKCVYRDLVYLNEPVPVHKAQAMCYAYIYSKEQNLETIRVQMTYCNLDTEEIKYFTEEYSFSYLEEWFFDLIKSYMKWARFQYDWYEIRTQSIKELEFPFSYREGQKTLVTSVYRTLARKKSLFIQAPTGVGKTMSTVFPTVKAMGEGIGDKLFYLTAKTITKTVAGEAFHILQRNGLRLKLVDITAKEKLCVCESVECNPDHCPYAKGHFDRINDAVYDLLQQEDFFTREVILSYAQKYQVCPFEFCLDVSSWSDAILCDYNYVFDPNVSLRRFFGQGVKGEYLFLIDEAHNLVDRAREMFSAILYKEDFLELKNQVKFYSRKLEKRLAHANQKLLDLKRECDTYCIYDNVSELVLSLLSLTAEIEKYFEEFHDADTDKKVLNFYFTVRHFLNIYERLDDNYVIYAEHEGDGRFKLKLFCVHTAKNLMEVLQKGNSVVFFSATMLPIQYYKELLRNNPEDYAIYAESPFDEQKRKLLIASDVTSKYSRRNQFEYERIANYIKRAINAKSGNYLAFFPSYRFMQEVYDCFSEEEKVLCLLQNHNMGEEERETFLEQFRQNSLPENKGSRVGFCVLGGIFGEGIDLKKDALIGAFIVGTGLPQVCNEREILKNYYDGRGENGFDYAYRFPGMNKVLQAAGRVIRTTEDVGIILLLDERFQSYEYQKLFPREWKQYQNCNQQNIEKQLEWFWTGIDTL